MTASWCHFAPGRPATLPGLTTGLAGGLRNGPLRKPAVSSSFPRAAIRRADSQECCMKSVVIAGYARSPFTLARKGELARVRPDDLAAEVVRGLIVRTGVPHADIEDLIL